MRILGLDPGLRHCAVAVLEDGAVTYGALVKNPEREARGPRAWRAMAEAFLASYPLDVDLAIFETMKVYRGFSRVDPADLLELNGVVGALTAVVLADRVEGVLAREWGGSVPKEVKNARVEARLTEADKAAVEWPAASLRHNVYDALGLAYFAHDSAKYRRVA